MKFIDNYIEFGHGSDVSVKDNISEKPISQKDSVLKYMKKYEWIGLRCASLTDFIKSELRKEPVYCYTDGEYKWTDEEIFHFEKYNMAIDEGFIKKALSA